MVRHLNQGALKGREMSNIIKIDGREAIPVRAIPFITGWYYSPDVIVEAFFKKKYKHRLPNLEQYHISPDGSIGKLLQRDWDVYFDMVNAFQDKIMEKYSDKREVYPEWQNFSISLLPSHCFVWRDEFEKGFYESLEEITFIDEQPSGGHVLNFNSMIPPKLWAVVYEGMPTQESKRGWPWGDYETDLLRKLAGAAEKFWTLYDPSDKSTAPTNSNVIQWLESEGVSQRTAKVMATILRANALPTGPRK
jgi:hypothetical protein